MIQGLAGIPGQPFLYQNNRRCDSISELLLHPLPKVGFHFGKEGKGSGKVDALLQDYQDNNVIFGAKREISI